ncbi:MAG: beta-ketoacyl-[acyl-carrier-protein] synthase family protein [Deltaproteobacteria bacterium]|nr:beta-ketoacyl-[acyl-carrier-protein] synthase family protein [Deltaproteobacteria bacterium]
MKRRVVITGMGIMTSIGEGLDDFWHNCLEAKSVVAPIPDHWPDYAEFTSTIWSPLPDIDFSAYNINRTEMMMLDKSVMLALSASKQALDQADLAISLKNKKKNTYLIEDINPNRSGVFMGSGIGGVNSIIANISNHLFTPPQKQLDQLKTVCQGTSREKASLNLISSMNTSMRMPFRFNPFVIPMGMPNACSANIGIKYSLHGPNITFCCSCAAGAVAIGHAFQAIQNDQIDLALSGGTEYLADDFGSIFRGFDTAKTLVKNCDNPLTANRPFDKNRSGFLFGEGGSAILILEELHHAKKRGAPIIAEVTGFAETFDAHNIMIMDPEAADITRMIRQALKQAGLAPSDIDYINAHATGTSVNDEIETSVIENCFGKGPLVNATKSLIGHTIGASAAIEAVVTALSIAGQTTHICKNLEDPIKDLNFVTTVKPFSIKKAISQSFGFGGHNAALILEEYEKP